MPIGIPYASEMCRNACHYFASDEGVAGLLDSSEFMRYDTARGTVLTVR